MRTQKLMAHTRLFDASAFLWKQIQEWSGIRDVINACGITKIGSWVAGMTVPDAAPENGLIGHPWGAVIRSQQARRKVPVRWYALDSIAPTSRGKVNRSNVAEICSQRQALYLPPLGPENP